MPAKGTLVNLAGVSVVFMDPSDPRIPYHTEYDGSTMHENRHLGYTQKYVTIISEEETVEAKKEDKRILKPYKSFDLTDDFADEYRIPQKKKVWSNGYYNDEGLQRAKGELEKADILRAIYPDWYIEETTNPAWYNEVPNTQILSWAGKGAELEPLKTAALAKIKDRELSDGTPLKTVATEYYDLLIEARTVWWDTYTPLLQSKGSNVALNAAKKASDDILENFIVDSHASAQGGGRRSTRKVRKLKGRTRRNKTRR
jgi:hypothetical protein